LFALIISPKIYTNKLSVSSIHDPDRLHLPEQRWTVELRMQLTYRIAASSLYHVYSINAQDLHSLSCATYSCVKLHQTGPYDSG